MNTNRLLIVLFILVALLSPENVLASSGASTTLPVVPVSNPWTGTTSRGHPMSFTVASNGTQWNTFKLKTDFNAASCGASGTMEITVPGPGNIASDHFNVSSGNFSAAGQFSSSTAANGTYTFTNHPIVISLPFPPFTCTYFFNQSGTWTASAPGGGGMVTLESIGSQDGWILESSETSSQGGGMNATTPTFLLGDNAANKQYRAILSFCPADLPFGANITQAKLKIKRQGLVGTDPFTTHNRIAVDIRQGSFSNNLALQLNDFKATASLNAVGLISNNPQAGNWYSVNLNSSAFPFIHVTSCIQLRLRFQLDDNNDLGADFLRFYSGDAVATARPKLILTYTGP